MPSGDEAGVPSPAKTPIFRPWWKPPSGASSRPCWQANSPCSRRALSRIAAGHFSTRDYTINRLREALQFYALDFPVYRTYVTAAGPSEHDRQTIESVIARARARWLGPDPQIFDFLYDAVTLDLLPPARLQRRLASAISR